MWVTSESVAQVPPSACPSMNWYAPARVLLPSANVLWSLTLLCAEQNGSCMLHVVMAMVMAMVIVACGARMWTPYTAPDVPDSSAQTLPELRASSPPAFCDSSCSHCPANFATVFCVCDSWSLFVDNEPHNASRAVRARPPVMNLYWRICSQPRRRNRAPFEPFRAI